MAHQQRELGWVIVILYLAALLRITVFRPSFLAGNPGELNLLPFFDLAEILKTQGVLYFLYLFLGNIVWFVPFGFLLGALVPRLRGWVVVFGFFLSLLIEALQYWGGSGVSEIDDLILNTLGTGLGYGGLCFLRRRITSRK